MRTRSDFFSTLLGHGGDKGLQEGARGLRIGLVDELGDRELGWAVDRDKEIELALRVCTSAMSTWKKPIG